MVFSSLVFLLAFLPLTVLCNYLVKNIQGKNIVLCLFSLLFYAWGEPVYIFLMVGMITANYGLAICMDRCKRARRLFLILALLVDLGAITFFKYGDFALVNLEQLIRVPMPRINLSLPIGISFFTFQIISYVIDVYRGQVPVQRNIIKLATYISLFPQLVAGPIVRYQTIAAELEERKESLSLFSDGLHRFVVGLGKKVVFANAMAMLADTVYNATVMPGGIVMWLGAMAYMLQIYYDFSGYSDMAIGIGHMFGFHFPENFNYPYIANSVTDFWRRWHITLSTCFRDYVYIPLGGNRKGKGRTILNMLVVWALTGLWHGAEWTFVLWGLYYFIWLTIEKTVGEKHLSKIPAILRHLAVLMIVFFGWILFRAESVDQFWMVCRNLFASSDTGIRFLLEHRDAVYPLWLLIPACLGCVPLAKKWQRNMTEKHETGLLVLRNVYDIIVLFICISLLLSATYNPFIYFRF